MTAMAYLLLASINLKFLPIIDLSKPTLQRYGNLLKHKYNIKDHQIEIKFVLRILNPVE
jgi:hypothetical protein